MKSEKVEKYLKDAKKLRVNGRMWINTDTLLFDELLKLNSKLKKLGFATYLSSGILAVEKLSKKKLKKES